MSSTGARRGVRAVDLLLIPAGIAVGGVLAACLWFIVVSFGPRYLVPNFADTSAMLRWWLNPQFFVREGDLLVGNHPSMPHRTFAAAKAAGTYRVFVTGGSQAMGDPYVHVWPETASPKHIRLRIDDNGGISTWLVRYLQMLYPDRRVEVINVAMAGQNTSTVAQQFTELVRDGAPDLVIVLSGNNEWVGPEIPAASFDRTVTDTATQYAADLNTIVAAAEKAQVPTYILTVPGNLRDWAPSTHDLPGRNGARQFLTKRRWESGMRYLEKLGAAESALYFYFRAHVRDAAGDFDGAYLDYVRARDLDQALTRAPTSFNEAAMRQDGHYVRAFDLESALRRYSANGIPGFDLFHDFCHMKIRGYMLAAKEIALFHQRDRQLPERELPDLSIPDHIRDSLRVLYAVKERKWADLAALPPASRLGVENIANASLEFQAEQNQLEDLHTAIRRYETDLQEVAGAE